MMQAILVIHLLTALISIGLIMMQQGKGADAGASFGAGASQTIFGSAGSWNFFSRMTAIFVTIFFITSISLAVIAKKSAVVDDPDLPAVETVEIPASVGDTPIPAAQDGEIPTVDSAPVQATEEIPQAEKTAEEQGQSVSDEVPVTEAADETSVNDAVQDAGDVVDDAAAEEVKPEEAGNQPETSVEGVSSDNPVEDVEQQ